MSNYREIVTKTIVGKGRKTFKSEHSLTPENTPNTVLGCWVINHTFNGTNNKNDVTVNGNFDVNVWYSYDNDSKTAVTTRNFTYQELLRLRVKDVDSLTNDNEIIVRSLKQPTVQDVKIKGNDVYLNIEKGDWFIATDTNGGKHVGTQIDPLYCHKASVDEIIKFEKE